MKSNMYMYATCSNGCGVTWSTTLHDFSEILATSIEYLIFKQLFSLHKLIMANQWMVRRTSLLSLLEWEPALNCMTNMPVKGTIKHIHHRYMRSGHKHLLMDKYSKMYLIHGIYTYLIYIHITFTHTFV